uniref:Uncharacterized protein n=1 Tax=Chrysotila carterae TaxID=13221 RepID=A0A7S4C6U0_CHRCT
MFSSGSNVETASGRNRLRWLLPAIVGIVTTASLIIAFPTLFLYGELVLFTFGAAMYSTSLPLAVVYIWLSSIILCAAGAFAAIWPSTALHVLFAAPVKLGTEEARVRCLLLFFIGMQMLMVGVALPMLVTAAAQDAPGSSSAASSAGSVPLLRTLIAISWVVASISIGYAYDRRDAHGLRKWAVLTCLIVSILLAVLPITVLI